MSKHLLNKIISHRANSKSLLLLFNLPPPKGLRRLRALHGKHCFWRPPTAARSSLHHYFSKFSAWVFQSSLVISVICWYNHWFCSVIFSPLVKYSWLAYCCHILVLHVLPLSNGDKDGNDACVSTHPQLLMLKSFSSRKFKSP